MEKESIGFEELQRLDTALRGRLPEAFREEMHLALIYAGRHTTMRLRELDTLRLLRDRPGMELSPETILEIYRVLTRGTDYEGRGWKTSNSYVKSEKHFYITLPAAETPAGMEDLCRRYRHLNDTARLQEDPEAFDDIFRFILEFICIHPFTDGNGRMSVFILLFLLGKAGLEHAVYIPQDYIQHIKYRNMVQKHIIRASGAFYGHKPLEFDLYVDFMKETVKESYEFLDQTIRELEG